MVSPGGKPSTPLGDAQDAAEAVCEDPVRNRILAAAATVFGQHGYAATSVEAILEAANVSRRTFYKRFRNKEDLLRVLFERSVKLLLRTVVQAAERQDAAADPMQSTRAAVDAYIGVLAEAGPLSRVLLQEQLAPDSPLSQQRDRAQRAFARLLSEGAVLRGADPPDPILTAGVVAAINQICIGMAEHHADGDWDLPRARSAILRVISALDR